MASCMGFFMNIANIIHDSIVDGPGFRLTVFTQGCPHRCEGCHNPETHDFSGGKQMSAGQLIKELERNPLLDGITLSGGEPFSQAAECLELARAAHERGLNVWAYTGYTYEYLLSKGDDNQKSLLKECDVLVDGPYIGEQRSLSLLWRGSANQRIIDVKKSLEANDVALWSRP